MKHLHLLTRPIAATAVVGLALMGFAGTASAATVTVSVPSALGTVISSPVVAVGPGWAAPVPGADATVPVHGDDTVSVDQHTLSPIIPAAHRKGALVSEHSSADACIAAALLTGHSPSGCGVGAGQSSTLGDSLSGVTGTPSLAGSLANVGACVQLALAAGNAVDSCSTSGSVPPVTVPTVSVPSVSVPSDSVPSVPVPPVDAAPVTVPGSIGDQANGLVDDGTLAAALVSSGLCSIGNELGLIGPCATGSDAGNGAGNSAANGANGSVETGGTPDASLKANATASDNVCLGLAVVTGVDVSRCAPGTVHALPHRHGHGTTANSTVGTTPAPATTPTAPLNAGCATRDSSAGSPSPLKGEAVGGFTALSGLLLGIGSLIRRMRRPVLA